MLDSALSNLAVLRLNKASRCLQSAERALAAGDAEDVRIYSDYDDSYIVSVSGVSAQVDNAREFLADVEKYVGERIKN